MDPRRDDRSFKQSSRSHHDDVEYGVAMTKVATRLFTRNKPLTLTICLSRLLQVQNRPVEKERLANFLAKNNVGLVIIIVLPLVKSYTRIASAWTHCIGAVDNMATPRTVSTGKECSRTVLLAKSACQSSLVDSVIRN